MNEQFTKTDIYNFLQGHEQKLGVLSTSLENMPQVAFVYYAVDQDLNIYIVTRMGSKKYTNILQNSKVAFAVATENPPVTAQIEGKAELVIDSDTQRELFAKIVEMVVSRNFIPPIEQFANRSETAFIKIVPIRATYSDFSISDKSKTFQEVVF